MPICSRSPRPYSWLLVSLSLLAALACWGHPWPVLAADDYTLGPDSQEKPGVPQGELIKLTFDQSKIYPGTTREVQIYVPKQYNAEQPAALMVFQDGNNYANRKGPWRVPTVFDNLIHEGAMPVTIGVFVTPGVVPSGSDQAQDRFNRSLEYDAVNDRYATFIINEILPLVKRSYSITDDPNRRAIGGASSGAIAAFGVAWHRPDQFRRVFSTIGTYVGLRGGDQYATMVRKMEPKPLRIFLQDGSGDLNIYGGDWWVANQGMLSALKYAGYQVQHQWGDGGHNSKHGAAILPEALRWLWKDHDQPIDATISDRHNLSKILVPGEAWQLVSEGHGFAEGPAVAPNGEVYFTSPPNGEIWKVDRDGTAARFQTDLPGVSGLMFDAQGNLYAAVGRKEQLLKFAPNGQSTVLADKVTSNDLVVLDHGIYVTDPRQSQVLYLPLSKTAAGSNAVQVVAKREGQEGMEFPNGLITTPDNRFLLVVDAKGHYVWSFRIAADGSLEHGQPYHYVHAAVDAVTTNGDGATMTSNGWLYVATNLGIQVFDQPGRCNGIIASPDNSRVTNVVFAGPKMNVLYATTASGKLFRRQTAATGVAPWQPATKPEKPGL